MIWSYHCYLITTCFLNLFALVANLDEVLQRGTALSDIQNKSSSLASFSAKYREDAKKINQRSK